MVEDQCSCTCGLNLTYIYNVGGHIPVEHAHSACYVPVCPSVTSACVIVISVHIFGSKTTQSNELNELL